MKKNLRTYYVLLALGLFMAGCSKEDGPLAIVPEIRADQKIVKSQQGQPISGATLLETISTTGELDMFNTSRSLHFFVQIQDTDLLDRVEITVSFVDNNPNDGDHSVDNADLLTVMADDFIRHQGVPILNPCVTMAELLKATGVALTKVLPGDQFVIDMEVFLTDGSSYDHSDAGKSGDSAYRYTKAVNDGIDFNVQLRSRKKSSLADPDRLFTAWVTVKGDNFPFFKTLNIYRSFADKTIVNGNDQSKELLYSSKNIEGFVNNYYRAGYFSRPWLVTTASNIPNLLNLVSLVRFNDIRVGDEFRERYEIVTTDGRVVTSHEKGTKYLKTITVITE